MLSAFYVSSAIIRILVMCVSIIVFMCACAHVCALGKVWYSSKQFSLTLRNF